MGWLKVAGLLLHTDDYVHCILEASNISYSFSLSPKLKSEFGHIEIGTISVQRAGHSPCFDSALLQGYVHILSIYTVL